MVSIEYWLPSTAELTLTLNRVLHKNTPSRVSHEVTAIYFLSARV